jgi:hypothetical protein
MMMVELEREQMGLEIFAENDMDECDKGKEMSLME